MYIKKSISIGGQHIGTVAAWNEKQAVKLAIRAALRLRPYVKGIIKIV